MTGTPLEIEYKYLIRYPDESVLIQQPGCSRVEIIQDYLLTDGSFTSRLRLWTENGETRYYHTVKKRVSRQTAEEHEEQIAPDVYSELLQQKDPDLRTIRKVRYRIPYEHHLMEIDIYPFWRHQAVLEVEISSENESVCLPSWIKILRDVTGEKAYKNVALAKNVPDEEPTVLKQN
jgi:CYTH domain-containing protein